MNEEPQAHSPFVDGWEPMDTAPKDGSRIIVWKNRGQEFGRWDDDKYASNPRPYWKTSGPWGVIDMRRNPPLAWRKLPPDFKP